jgi:hypothetical protein
MAAAPQLTEADWIALEREWARRQIIYGGNAPQQRLLRSEARYPALVAGYGTGKTGALVRRVICQKLRHWSCNQAYYLPTYDLVRQIAFPNFTALLGEWGLDFKLNRNDNEITFPDGSGKIIFRTMDRPERIVGYEVADSAVDELDTLKADDAQDVWNKIIARNRQKKPGGVLNTVAVGTTPEGYRFVYDRWARQPLEGYELIRGSTYENQTNLPDGYIEDLQRNYPAQLLEAYLNGQFVNLTAGSVYPEFDRNLNATTETIQPGELLHVGMDFNVANMAAVVNVQRNGEPRALDELIGLRDTPHMIAALKERYANHHITVYPDQSGKSRRSINASTSDLSLLQEAGFRVHRTGGNPLVKDRVLAMNQMIHADGERRLLVNTDTCPNLTMSLEQQAYDKNGEPDKTNGWDHVVDAQGYFVHARYPLKPRAITAHKLRWN